MVLLTKKFHRYTGNELQLIGKVYKNLQSAKTTKQKGKCTIKLNQSLKCAGENYKVPITLM